MKIFTRPQELQQTPSEIREHLAAIVGQDGNLLEYALGGPVCIVEELAALETKRVFQAPFPIPAQYRPTRFPLFSNPMDVYL